MDKDTTKSIFSQLFSAINDKEFLKLVMTSEVDKYVKKLTTPKLIALVALAQLEQLQGLREISINLHDEQLQKELGIDSISSSQISRRLREIPPQLTQMLFKKIIWNSGAQLGQKHLQTQLDRLYLIDSSTISFCLKNHEWAEFRQSKGAVKLHLRLVFHKGDDMYPDEVIVTPAKPADKTQMDNLVVVEKDALNVFDRGYVDYVKFDDYCSKGIRFVTRLKHNAIVEVLEDYPITPDSPIKKHQMVRLGKPGQNQMKKPLILIETVDTNGNAVTIITNDFSKSVDEISDIYRYRWQIELFFKWIKQHFTLKHFFGNSQIAVENQIFIALITYCLLKLLQLKTGYRGNLLQIQRLARICLYESFEVFIQKLYQRNKSSSKGRRKLNHEIVYEALVEQVKAGNHDHLNDLTYDPVIL